MAFASTDDISDRLGRALTDGETQSIEFLLDGATAGIAEAVDQDDDWADNLSPVPRIVRTVCVEVVCRALANPNALDSLQESLGQHNYSARFRNDGGGLMLTKAEELLVRRVLKGRLSDSATPDSVATDYDNQGWWGTQLSELIWIQ